MKKAIACIMGIILTATAVCADIGVTDGAGNEKAAAPVFSVKSGVYENTVQLSLYGGGDIYYTLNGDEPSLSASLYTAPITLSEEKASPRTVQGYVAQEQTPRGITVRAAVVNSDGSVGEIATETYFIGSGINEFYELPMINLAVDTYDLWSRADGIYENYNYEHNVPAYFQYFTTDGSVGAERGIEIKVSGHGSRYNAKKSVRLYFTKGDVSEGKYLEYELIPNTRANYKSDASVNKFAKLTLRISDWTLSNLRDVFAQKLGSYTRADVAASTPTALFLNGEYWGVYECREQYDERYVEYHYGIDNDNVVFLDRDWTLDPQYTVLPDTGSVYTDKMEYSAGPSDANKKGRLGESYYREQWLYLRSLAEEGDIADPDVYAEFCAGIDIDNYIDSVITYIYSANDDWPGNNFKLWRVTEESIDPYTYGADGKWRFMIHDFDIAFESSAHETLYLSALEKLDDTDARHPAFATAMLGGLLKNADFRSEFAQRTMAYLSTAMSSDNANRLVDGLIEERSVGKLHDLLRWNLGSGSSENRMEGWINSVNTFRAFADERPAALCEQYTNVLNENYGAGIDGAANFTFLSASGEFSINGAEISAERYDNFSSFSTVQFAGIPIRVSAVNENGEAAKLTVTHNGITDTFYGEAEFVPEAADYTVSADFSDPCTLSDPVPVGIARANRFLKMKTGEKLPVVLFDSDGGRISADSISVTGSGVQLTGSVAEAVSVGRATIRAVCGGRVFEAEIAVSE